MDDHPRFSLFAKTLIEEAADGHVVVELLPIIVAEVVYTLSSYYKKADGEIAQALLGFIRSPGVKTHERDRLIDTLKRFSEYHVDFADAYLAAASADTQVQVASFDRDLDQFKDISRMEPQAI